MLRRTLFLVLALTFALPLQITAAAAQEADVVAKHRGSSPTLSPADAPRVLKAIAADLNALAGPDVYGVLRKTTGNNCGGYSCDIICRADGLHWDVFVDGPEGETNTPGPSRPSWQDKGAVDPTRCEVVPAFGPAPGPVDPPPPPPPGEEPEQPGLELGPILLKVIALLEELRDGQVAARAATDGQTAALKAAIAELQAQVRQGVKIRF